ncbi:MAG: hypothetical protein ABI682_13215 [Acidobacteriota bacterium]
MKTASARSASQKKTTPRPAPAKKKKTSPRISRTRGEADLRVEEPLEPRGMGADSGGQSGDTEGLSREEDADSESVEELVEEGQAYEAGVISGVERGRTAGKRGVRTRQVPVDDVPQEYLDED